MCGIAGLLRTGGGDTDTLSGLARRMALVWGVTPLIVAPYATTDEMVLAARLRPSGGGPRAGALPRATLAAMAIALAIPPTTSPCNRPTLYQ